MQNSVPNWHSIFFFRRRRRHRLPKSALKKLPIHKFKDGDPYETCCICLDDFEEGDKLRILPCDHGYHYKCIGKCYFNDEVIFVAKL